jgi:16S rRNA processing protein RimM
VDADWVVVADILRPRGNRGELLAVSQTDVPGRLETLKQATVRLSNGSQISVEIEAAWTHSGFSILKLKGVDSISAAEGFRGADLCVPVSERGDLAEGEYFQSDLLGCLLVERASGNPLGPVEGFEHCGGPPLIEVRVDGREVLIPFVPSICKEVNLAARKIFVDLPDGLLDL